MDREPTEDGVLVAGQRRARALSETLRRARLFAVDAGITRLADLTGLDRVGIPVFQAVRPLSLSLSVSQGKGLTPMAAMVSALLESVEAYVAETLPMPGDDGSPDTDWYRDWDIANAPGAALALPGRDLLTGRADQLPWQTVSMDFTRPRPPGRLPSTVGLAAGNSEGEALCSALAEVVENELNQRWHGLPDGAKAGSRLDLGTVDDPVLLALLRAAGRAGLDVALWFTGAELGIAAFACVVVERDELASFAPAFGSGCHPTRAVAAVRALLEALQVRITMIAGARDDIDPRLFGMAGGRRAWTAPPAGSTAWGAIPDRACADQAELMDALLAPLAREARCGRLVARELECRHGLAVVKVMASGFGRELTSAVPTAMPRLVTPARRASRGDILFYVGPSWPEARSDGRILVRPPVMGGDLARLRDNLPAAVAIVDGCFETVPAVWHKEIIDLLSNGVAVYGAASMGAIRAAELESLGMIGIGRVFEAYRTGAIVRDDAVMVSQAPPELGNRALSVSLVDAEAAIVAVDLDPKDRRMLLRIVRRLNYRDRTWPRVADHFARVTGRCLREPIIGALARSPSVKRIDAMRLFESLQAKEADAPRAPVALPETIFYRNMAARLGPLSAA
jgi:ribosomal protein S12 methylthiotransferase accessory factor